MFELWILALVLITVGLVGTVVPALPGMPLVLGGIALYTIGSGFGVIGGFEFALFVVVGVLGMGLDFLGNLIGAKRFGASRLGMLGAIVGLVLGLITLGPVGILVGPLVGAIGFELAQGRQARDALRSGFGVVVGYLFGSLAEAL